MKNKYNANGYGSIVDAIYTEPKCAVDKDNILITALPDPLLIKQDLVMNYTKGLPSYNFFQSCSLPRIERRFLVPQLRNVRIFLPFEASLETEFYNAMVNSYRLRRILKIDSSELYSKVVGNTGEATNAGFSLLGYSGCGKSSAISMLTSHYPQVIRHHLPDGSVLSQILYIVVSCNSTNNFAELYGAIGREIDKALHTDIYERLINSCGGLGKKQNKVIELIEKFGIGICILDEIQQLSFSSTKTNTFESFLTISNSTKVAIGVVGTEDGYYKMFQTLRTARRLGYEISATAYCNRKTYFSFVMQELFKYQWLDHKLVLTKDLINTFYDETRGIIDQAVSLWIAVQDEYLLKKTHFTITPAFVSEVYKKRYPHLRRLIHSIVSPEVNSKIEKIMSEANLKYQHDLEASKQTYMMEQVENDKDFLEIGNLICSVTEAIKVVNKRATDQEIEAECKAVISEMSADQRTVDNVAPIVNDRLLQKKKQTPKKQRKVSKEDMLNSVMGGA